MIVETVERTSDWVSILLGNVSGIDAVLIIIIICQVYLAIRATKSNAEVVIHAIESIRRIAYGAIAIRVALPIIEKIISLI